MAWVIGVIVVCDGCQKRAGPERKEFPSDYGTITIDEAAQATILPEGWSLDPVRGLLCANCKTGMSETTMSQLLGLAGNP